MTNESAYEGRDLEAMAVLSRYYAWIMEEFEPHLSGDAMELGAGQGTIAERLINFVDTLDLVEPSSNLFDQLCEKFGEDEKVTLFNTTLEAQLASCAPESKDAVVMVNVLEHIEDDGAALTGIRAVLRPGGRLLIFVPAMSWLMSDFDRLVGHFRRYHKRPLVELIKGAGFEVQSARYCDILGVLPWLVLNRFLGSTSLNPTLAQIYDRVGTPVTRALELLFTPPLGKNVILVARKPAGRASGQEQQGSSALAGQ